MYKYIQTLWTGETHDTVLDDVVDGAAESLGASETTVTILQGSAGAAGNPAHILKEGGERYCQAAERGHAANSAVY